MKSIVLIGKPNAHLQEMFEFLRRYFRVQLCAQDAQSALAMIKVSEPDLIVMSLAGFTQADQALFAGIQSSFPQLPVLTVGAAEERFLFGPYYLGGQFENLSRLEEKETLLSAICKRMGVSEQSVRDEAAAAHNDGKKKVLVVDDNANTLRSIKAMLEEKYNVTLANSGMKALTSIGKSRPDVILLDYEMPVCDGRQTLEMIRADEELTTIPVIFLTSVNDKEQIQAVIKLLPAGYLLKPPVPERLIETIEQALGGAQG